MLFILHSYILYVFANINYYVCAVVDYYNFGSNKRHESNKLATLVCFQ